mgnify:CR=1 FL=1
MKEPNRLNKKNKRIKMPIGYIQNDVWHIEKKVVSLRGFFTPEGNIEKGDSYYLKDAYIEGGNIVLGVKVNESNNVMECVFQSDFKNIEESKEFIGDIILPYFDNATYNFL